MRAFVDLANTQTPSVVCFCGVLLALFCVSVCGIVQRFLNNLEEEFGPVIVGQESEAATGANEYQTFFDPSLLEVSVTCL